MTDRERTYHDLGFAQFSAEDSRTLVRLGRTLRTLAERACSDPNYSDRDAARQKRAEASVRRIVAQYTYWTAETSRDPRGAVLRLTSKAGKHIIVD